MARVATGVIAALGEEDRLDLRPEGLEIEAARTGGGRRGALSLQSGPGTDEDEEDRKAKGCSAHGRFIYGGPASVQYADIAEADLQVRLEREVCLCSALS